MSPAVALASLFMWFVRDGYFEHRTGYESTDECHLMAGLMHSQLSKRHGSDARWICADGSGKRSEYICLADRQCLPQHMIRERFEKRLGK